MTIKQLPPCEGGSYHPTLSLDGVTLVLVKVSMHVTNLATSGLIRMVMPHYSCCDQSSILFFSGGQFIWVATILGARSECFSILPLPPLCSLFIDMHYQSIHWFYFFIRKQ